MSTATCTVSGRPRRKARHERFVTSVLHVRGTPGVSILVLGPSGVSLIARLCGAGPTATATNPCLWQGSDRHRQGFVSVAGNRPPPRRICNQGATPPGSAPRHRQGFVSVARVCPPPPGIRVRGKGPTATATNLPTQEGVPPLSSQKACDRALADTGFRHSVAALVVPCYRWQQSRNQLGLLLVEPL